MHRTHFKNAAPGLEVIKLEYSLRLKKKSAMIGCLRIRKQPILALYFESENELKFYNLEPRPSNVTMACAFVHFQQYVNFHI